MNQSNNTNTADNRENEKNRWIVYYQDDSVNPIGVLATDRHTAQKVASKARQAPQPMAIREDEGAESDLKGLTDDQLSTLDYPTRFIEEVLHS